MCIWIFTEIMAISYLLQKNCHAWRRLIGDKVYCRLSGEMIITCEQAFELNLGRLEKIRKVDSNLFGRFLGYFISFQIRIIFVQFHPNLDLVFTFWCRLEYLQRFCISLSIFRYVDSQPRCVMNSLALGLSISATLISRTSRPDVFCKNDVFYRNFVKLTGIHLCQSLFFNKVAGLRSAYEHHVFYNAWYCLLLLSIIYNLSALYHVQKLSFTPFNSPVLLKHTWNKELYL